MDTAWEDRAPSLPPGGSTQSVWGFHDRGLHYEFVRVYGPVDSPETNVAHLDEPLSYWRASWEGAEVQGAVETNSRWLSYTHARQLRRLTFGQFSSIEEMRSLTRTIWRLHP
jgi:hypothetical protein